MVSVQSVLNDWYGMPMPCRIVENQTEIDEFETNHPEVPPSLWELVNHNVRVWRMWMTDVVAIVVRRDGTYVMIQDVCYRAAYPDATSWHRSVGELLREEAQYWLCFHPE
jgi:hypothetical protein